MTQIGFFFALWMLLSASSATFAQNVEPSPLNIGDTAPRLQLGSWLKGQPVTRFEKGKIYVLELWATWCVPCKAAMPHLSALAEKYRDKVTFIGVDVYENKKTSFAAIKHFVDTMGKRMDYNVATGDSIFAASWMDAAGERGIPRTFVIDGDGKLAWIGHPKNLAGVLEKVVTGSWDNNAALALRRRHSYLTALEDSLKYQLFPFRDDPDKPFNPDKADTTLSRVKKIVAAEPALQYAPVIAGFTFSALLIKDPSKACEFGRNAIAAPSFGEPLYGMFTDAIWKNSVRQNLPTTVFAFGAEACEAEIKSIPYPETVDMYKLYRNQAEFYWRAGNKPGAIAAGQTAVDNIKARKPAAAGELTALLAQLKKYKDM